MVLPDLLDDDSVGCGGLWSVGLLAASDGYLGRLGEARPQDVEENGNGGEPEHGDDGVGGEVDDRRVVYLRISRINQWIFCW